MALFLPLARELKRRYNSHVIVYVRTEPEIRAFESYLAGGSIDRVRPYSVIPAEIVRKIDDPERVFAEALKIEAELGMTVNELAMSHRQLGRGFSLAGPGYPRSGIYSRASHAQMVHAVQAQVQFWRREFIDNDLTLLLQGGPEAAAVAGALNVPYRFLITARYRDYWFWSTNRFQDNPDLAEVYRSSMPGDPEEISVTYTPSKLRQAHRLRSLDLTPTIKNSLEFALKWPYWRMRGYPAAYNAGWIDGSLMPWRERWRYREALREHDTALRELAGKPFVFFPLHKEPEAALSARSPECFAQHAIIAALARDLPAGVVLAVKELPGTTARRPREFYRQLRDLKNVRLIDMDESGVSVVRAATAVATITGSAGLEGALMGKPVLLFGRHALYNVLPHVRTITDDRQIKPALTWALDPDFDHDAARREGARFVAAIRQTCFRLPGFRFTTLDRSRVTPGIVEVAARGLAVSLSVTT